MRVGVWVKCSAAEVACSLSPHPQGTDGINGQLVGHCWPFPDSLSLCFSLFLSLSLSLSLSPSPSPVIAFTILSIPAMLPETNLWIP